MEQKLEEEKYYIPSHSEMCVDFEYEYRKFIGFNSSATYSNGKTYTNEWTDWFKSNDPFELDYDGWAESSPMYWSEEQLNGDRYQCRVKYLSKEDIEELLKDRLDFETIIYEEDSQFEFQFWKGGMKYSGLYTNSDKIISFYERVDECIFRGEVKNKSELKFIIRSINI